MTGNTIIIILLVPIAFQIFMLAIKQEKRHQEIKQLLKSLEDRLNK